MASHMVPKTKYVASFKCPNCGFWKKVVVYALQEYDRSKCRRLSCLGCGSYFNLPFEVELLCTNCHRRIECLLAPRIEFFKDVKILKEVIPIWTDRIARVREKGTARVAKNGNIHRALGSFRAHGKSYSGVMRGSKYGMWEVMLMLTYGFIEKHGPMGVRGGHYTITQLGEDARNQLDISEKRKGQLVSLTVSIDEKWFEYFKHHQW